MITAVDSSVLLDVLTNSAEYSARSYAALSDARQAGRVVACPVVWAEVAALLEGEDAMTSIVEAGIEFDPFDRAASEVAGRMWREYRAKGGSRTRPIPDFLVAAHAQVRADALLSRDRGFGRRYFPELRLIAP